MRSISKSAAYIALLLGVDTGLLGSEMGAGRAWRRQLLHYSASVSSPAGSAMWESSMARSSALISEDMYKFVGGELRYDTCLEPESIERRNGSYLQRRGACHPLRFPVSLRTHGRQGPAVRLGWRRRQDLSRDRNGHRDTAARAARATHEYLRDQGLAVAGAGIKATVARTVSLRIEVHDFITPFPRRSLPRRQARRSAGILNDIVVMGGISILF